MAGTLSPATREQIRAASDIVEIIGAVVSLKRAGANFVGLCPFHREKTPSFNVNPQRQIFHCFGCHKGGDVFAFLQEYENIGFMDVIRRLAERARIPLEFDDSPAARQSRHIKDQLLEIHEQLTQRWQNCLAADAAGQMARDYLAKRGVSPEAVNLFRLGAAPDEWDDTVNWARSKNYDLATVEHAGLIIRKEETGRYYDRFRGRLMFPICDEQGRVIGFSGRILAGDEKTAKYVNSPETPIFTKSKVFYGLDKSKRAILDAGCAIICEGQLDLIACYMNGIRNLVAPQGTAFTDQHARILKRYINEVVLCFDSDNAGQNAAVRVLDHLLGAGLAIRVAVVPAPYDPDSFIKENGGPAFQQLIDRAEGFFDFYLKRLCATHDLGTDKGRLAVLQSMAEAVHKTGNTMLVDTYAQKTAHRLGVSIESVRAEFRKTAVNSHSQTVRSDSAGEAESEAAANPPARPTPAEFQLLKILFIHEELVAWAHAHLDPAWITHPPIHQLIDLRFAAHEHQTWQALTDFLDTLETPDQRSLLTEAVTDNRALPNPEIQLPDIILRLRNEALDRQITVLRTKISHPDTLETEREELLRLQLTLRTAKRLPLSPRADSV